MEEKSLVRYIIEPAGNPWFVFALVNVCRDTMILDLHNTIGISCGLYLGIHRCIFTTLILEQY